MQLTVYGDFNCPYSALANYRTSWLEATQTAQVNWRAVEHDPTIPKPSRSVEGPLATDIDRELADVLDRLAPGEVFPLRRPPVQPNTHLVNQRYAGIAGDPLAHPAPLRRRIFRALWVNGKDLGDEAVVDRLVPPETDRRRLADDWHDEYLSLPSQTVPSVVATDGEFLVGKHALHLLAELGRTRTTTSFIGFPRLARRTAPKERQR